MKEPSVIRTVYSLGRIVLPQELRRALGLHKGIPLLLRYRSSTGEVTLARRPSACVFCGAEKNIKPYRALFFCAACQAALAQTVKEK